MHTDPDTGRTTRKRNPRPPQEWMRRQDEALRIVPDKLWRRCEVRMAETAERNKKQKYRGGRRRQRLFDLVCAECGGRYVLVNARQLGCATNRNGGESACTNGERIWLKDANKVLLDVLRNPKDGLLCERELKALRRDVAAEVQRRKREAARESGAAKQLRAQLAENEKRQERVADGMEKHGYTDVLAKRLKALEKERRELEAKLAHTDGGKLDQLPDIVPDLMRRYRAEIGALAGDKHGLSVQDLAKARTLIGEILDGPVTVDATLTARVRAQTLVAGAGFEPATFGL